MKVSVVFLLALCSLSVGVNGWRCYWGPRLNNAYQIDAGAQKVVARDTRYYAYMLFWGSWRRLSFTRFRHISVGDAGLWGVGTNYRVYKSTSGRFRSAYGLSMRMVDAGGNKQIVGSTTSSRAYCLKSRTASTYSGGYQRWTYLYRSMKYYSCSPRNGCWGVDRWNRVYHTQYLSPSSCRAYRWRYVSGRMKMIEVGSDGTVVAVDAYGRIWQRIGISGRYPSGTRWRQIRMYSKARHVSYDRRTLWVVTTSGSVRRCTH